MSMFMCVFYHFSEDDPQDSKTLSPLAIGPRTNAPVSSPQPHTADMGKPQKRETLPATSEPEAFPLKSGIACLTGRKGNQDTFSTAV